MPGGTEILARFDNIAKKQGKDPTLRAMIECLERELAENPFDQNETGCPRRVPHPATTARCPSASPIASAAAEHNRWGRRHATPPEASVARPSWAGLFSI